MSIVSLLGVSQVSSHKEILSILQRNAITSIFYEQEHMGKNLDQTMPIYSEGKDFPDTPFFIFSEFWLTQLIQNEKLKKTPRQIAQNALKACRSKLFFSTILEKNHIPCVHREKIDKAPNDILSKGCIVRPDCAYSGKGVKHITSPISYSQYLKNTSSELSLTMKNVMGEQNIDFIEEEYLDGAEYSCDVIISPFGRKVIRVCYKKIKWINGYPCTVAYITVPLSREMESAILSWCNVLFTQEDNLSFAQFDFIKKRTEHSTPLIFLRVPVVGSIFYCLRLQIIIYMLILFVSLWGK